MCSFIIKEGGPQIGLLLEVYEKFHAPMPYGRLADLKKRGLLRKFEKFKFQSEHTVVQGIQKVAISHPRNGQLCTTVSKNRMISESILTLESESNITDVRRGTQVEVVKIYKL